ncbi:MAG: SCO family protein [Bdellovibrionales bacterium]|nr:SCO family protein [Bdellovibrionales bacterium]
MLIFSVSCKKAVSIASEYPTEVTAFASEGGEGLPYFVGQDLRPAWNVQTGPAPRSLSSFHLTDQNSKNFTSHKLQGKVTIVSFFFTKCPGICPVTTARLRPVQKKFLQENRIEMLSFSITPEIDTPEQLTKFAKVHHINDRRWHLLTGDKTSIYRLARESFNADTFSPKANAHKKITASDFLHSENVYLLDGELKVRGIYTGRDTAAIQNLIRDAESLLQ